MVLRCCVCCLVLLAGCGRSAAPLAAVSGQVFYRGQPLTGGTIVFTPDPERGGSGPQAWAEIKADGRFQLLTDAQGRHAGLAPRHHRPVPGGLLLPSAGPLPRSGAVRPALRGQAGSREYL